MQNRKPYLFNMNRRHTERHNIPEIMESLQGEAPLVFSAESHVDVKAINSKLHSIISEGNRVQVTIRRF